MVRTCTSRPKLSASTIDFKYLLAEFARRGTLVRAYYYTAIFEDAGFKTIRLLTDWFRYNGFTVVTKPTKQHTDGEGRRAFKRNLGAELSVDAIEIARHVDQSFCFRAMETFAGWSKQFRRKVAG